MIEECLSWAYRFSCREHKETECEYIMKRKIPRKKPRTLPFKVKQRKRKKGPVIS